MLAAARPARGRSPALIGVAIFAIVVYAGLAGVQTSTANLTPTVVYVLFWVGIPVAQPAVRRRVPAVQPVAARSAAGRGWLVKRARRGRRAAGLSRAGSGRWPAALGILAFAWVELVYANKDDPSTLADHDPRLRGRAARGHEPLRRSTRGRATPTRSASTSASSRACRRCTGARRRAAPRSPLGGAPRPGPGAGHRGAAVHADRHDELRRHSRRGRCGPGPKGSAPAAAALPRTSASTRRRRWRSRSRSACSAWCSLVSGRLPPRRARDALGRAARIGRASWRARFAHSLIPIALAYVVAHYFSLLALPGAGDRLPDLRPARARLEHLRHRRRDDRLQRDQRQRGLVRAGRGARRSATPAASRSPTTARWCSYRAPARGHALAVLDARGDDRLHQPRAVAPERGELVTPPDRPLRPLVRDAAVHGPGGDPGRRAVVPELAREATQDGDDSSD